MFVCQPENENQQSVLGRDPEQIKALMKMQQGTTEISKQKYPDVSYEEACQMYKYYKSRTHKVDQEDKDFEQNLEFREFFLGIKKRYDMQERARRFRHKQKAEIAYLRDFAEKKSDTGIVSLLGKRSRCEVDPKFLSEMEVKIKNLENMVQQKNQQIQDLIQEKSLKKQKTTDVSQTDQSTLVTKQKSGGSTLENTIEEVLIENKPEILVSDCDNDEYTNTGQHSVNSKKRQLIVKIDTTIEPSFQYEESYIEKDQLIEPFDTSKSCIEEEAPSCQNEQSAAAMSNSERAQNFMQSNRIQKLLQKIVDQKLEYTNILKYKEQIKQINEKEAEIRSDRQLLSHQMNEFLQQKLTFARLRQQPEQLLAKRNHFMKSIEGLEQEIRYIEQNYNNTLCYMDEQEQMLQESEEQIQMMNEKINHNLSELEDLKENQYQFC